jgi:hypothetical protein
MVVGELDIGPTGNGRVEFHQLTSVKAHELLRVKKNLYGSNFLFDDSPIFGPDYPRWHPKKGHLKRTIMHESSAALRYLQEGVADHLTWNTFAPLVNRDVGIDEKIVSLPKNMNSMLIFVETRL